jgi:hypothetical protein
LVSVAFAIFFAIVLEENSKKSGECFGIKSAEYIGWLGDILLGNAGRGLLDFSNMLQVAVNGSPVVFFIRLVGGALYQYLALQRVAKI